MAGLADMVLSGIKGYAQGEQEVQQRALTQQTLAANQRVLNKDRDKKVGSLITGTDLQQFYKFNNAGDSTQNLIDFDVVSAYEKNPEATREFLNTIPSSLLAAQDEKGNTINVKVAGIRPVKVEGQEMFAVEVMRPDGKKAPLTRRGTAAPDDNVVLMSREDLNGLASQKLVSMFDNGAFDTGSFFARGMGQIQDQMGLDNARKEQALRDEVSEMISVAGVPVAEGREIYGMFSQLQGDDLLRAAKDFGIDVDAVFAQYAEEDPLAATGDTGSTAGLGNSETRGEDLGKAVSGLKTVITDPKKAMSDIGGLSAIMGDTKAKPAVMPAPSNSQKDPNAPTLSDVQRRINGETPPDAAQSSISPALQAAPEPVQQALSDRSLTPEQRKNAILQAVEEGLSTPNEEQVGFVRDYMLKKGYKTPSSLASAPPEEVMNIAYTLAAAADVPNMADRLSLASSILNFAQFGDPKTSTKDLAELDLKRAQYGLDVQKEERLRQAGVDTKNEDVMKTWRTANDAAQDIITEVRAGIKLDKRGFVKGAPDVESRRALNNLTSRYKAVQGKDPAQEQAYQDAFADIFPDYMAAHMIGEPRSSLWEWVSGTAQDIWTRAPYREFDSDFGSFRIIYDDKGAPKALELMAPKGQTAERGRVNMSQLKGFLGGGELLDFFLSTIEQTSELKQAQQ